MNLILPPPPPLTPPEPDESGFCRFFFRLFAGIILPLLPVLSLLLRVLGAPDDDAVVDGDIPPLLLPAVGKLEIELSNSVRTKSGNCFWRRGRLLACRADDAVSARAAREDEVDGEAASDSASLAIAVKIVALMEAMLAVS